MNKFLAHILSALGGAGTVGAIGVPIILAQNQDTDKPKDDGAPQKQDTNEPSEECKNQAGELESFKKKVQELESSKKQAEESSTKLAGEVETLKKQVAELESSKPKPEDQESINKQLEELKSIKEQTKSYLEENLKNKTVEELKELVAQQNAVMNKLQSESARDRTEDLRKESTEQISIAELSTKITSANKKPEDIKCFTLKSYENKEGGSGAYENQWACYLVTQGELKLN